jgi:hypothetical protein
VCYSCFLERHVLGTFGLCRCITRILSAVQSRNAFASGCWPFLLARETERTHDLVVIPSARISWERLGAVLERQWAVRMGEMGKGRARIVTAFFP